MRRGSNTMTPPMAAGGTTYMRFAPIMPCGNPLATMRRQVASMRELASTVPAIHGSTGGSILNRR